MKGLDSIFGKLGLLVLFVFAIVALSAQELTNPSVLGPTPVLDGVWEGTLEAGSARIKLVFNVETREGRIIATMDSPDQRVFGIPVSHCVADGSKIIFTIESIQGAFEGVLQADYASIVGNWKQGGAQLPLVLKKTLDAGSMLPSSANSINSKTVSRPQEPIPPFPYVSKDVIFSNSKANVQLAGTLVIPEGRGPFPAAVFVSGSGPQDRDEQIFGHKPFLVIADYLARRGIASLRYDDRGIGRSSGDFASATTFDFAEDAEAGLSFLAENDEIDGRKIGIIGHSEGAIIASIIASRTKDLDFAVLLAGTGFSGEELLYLQSAAIARASGADEAMVEQARSINASLYAIAKKDGDSASLELELLEFLGNMFPSSSFSTEEERIALKQQTEMSARQLVSPWFRSFLVIDPSKYLSTVHVPILVLNGTKDLQVPAQENLKAIAAALKKAGNERATFIQLEGMNHLFQKAKTGLPLEYGELEETFSPTALSAIGNWLEALF